MSTRRPGARKKPSARRRAREPARSLLTRRELATALDCDPRTIAKWIEEGLPVARRGRGGRPSLFDLAKGKTWKTAREGGLVNGPNASASPMAIAQAELVRDRARRERAQAVVAEQLFQTRQRLLLPVEEVERAWAAEVAAVRAAILATYTTQADRLHRVAVLEGVAGVEHALRELAQQLLRELSSPERPLPSPQPTN